MHRTHIMLHSGIFFLVILNFCVSASLVSLPSIVGLVCFSCCFCLLPPSFVFLIGYSPCMQWFVLIWASEHLDCEFL